MVITLSKVFPKLKQWIVVRTFVQLFLGIENVVEFEGEDVVFLYLSIDKSEQKWRTLVETKGLTGVQLIAGKEKNKISQAYRVSGVPKYILVDKEGNIADSMAKRPSQHGIADDIQKLLKPESGSN